jgi:hypothetical protein
MSNLIAFPTAETRAQQIIDRALERFHAADDAAGRTAGIEAMIRVALGNGAPEAQARAARWLAEVLNVTVPDGRAPGATSV